MSVEPVKRKPIRTDRSRVARYASQAIGVDDFPATPAHMTQEYTTKS